MPFTTPKSTHAQNRAKVCLMCFQKGKAMRNITEGVLKQIHSFFISNYDPSELKMPNAICSRCRVLLGQTEKKEKQFVLVDLPDPIDFSKLTFPTITRSSGVTNLGELMGCS